MQQTDKKLFIKDFIKSIKDFDYYYEFANEKVANTILYVVKIVAIFSFIISLVITLKFISFKNILLNEIDSKIEEISYKNESLIIKSKVDKLEINDGFLNVNFIVNTDEINQDEIEQYMNKVQVEENLYVILKDKIIAKSPLENDIKEFSYKTLSEIRNRSFYKRRYNK